MCDLEKFYIIFKPELASLNQRNELATIAADTEENIYCFTEVTLHSSGHLIEGLSTVYIQNLAGLCC